MGETMRRITTAAIAVAGTIAGVVTGVAITSTPAVADAQPATEVVVVDRTAGTWSGAQRAAASWSKSPHVDVQVARQCDPTAYCVVVQQPTSYDRDWLGYWQPVSRHVSIVQLNSADKRAGNVRLQQWVVCHELGHALGLGETYTGQAACMRDANLADAPTRATGRDLAMLDQVASNGAPDGTALAYLASAVPAQP